MVPVFPSLRLGIVLSLSSNLSSFSVFLFIFSASFSHVMSNPPSVSKTYTKENIDGVKYLWLKVPIYKQSKSLGRLNVIINIHDTVAKINIIAESANAAALLGDAESKLSQMMEVSGLRLASLQTQTNQFGGNHKGKEQGQKLASTVKKANIEDSSKPIENIDKKSSANEGLNLIA